MWLMLLLPVELALVAGAVWLLNAYLKRGNPPHEAALAEAEQRLRAAMAEAERRDGPWQLEDVEARRRQVPDAENAARVLDKVRAKLHPDWPSFRQPPGPYTKGQPAAPGGLSGQEIAALPPPALLPVARLARLREELGDAAAALAEARSLADRPHGRFPLTWAGPYYTGLGETPDVGQAPALLTYDALLLAQEGDLAGALRSCRALLHTASAIGDQPTFAAQRLRCALRDEALPPIERVLALGESPGPALAALQDRLAAEGAVPLMLLAARGERAVLDRLLQAMQAGQVPVSRVLSGPDFRRGRQARRSPADKKLELAQARAVVLETMNRKVALHQLPPGQPGRFRELDEALKKESPLVRALCSVKQVEEWLFPVSRARLRCAAVALAVERYRQEHGRWPDQLADLVPEFLSAVPADPFDGAPLRYCRQEEGVAVYALGRGPRDDGGAFATLNNPLATNNVGFRLWDTERRRRPAK
jgi:hypothetical protein